MAGLGGLPSQPLSDALVDKLDSSSSSIVEAKPVDPGHTKHKHGGVTKLVVVTSDVVTGLVFRYGEWENVFKEPRDSDSKDELVGEAWDVLQTIVSGSVEPMKIEETDDEPESDSDLPWEAEMNLEPTWDCPECDWLKTGLTASGHALIDHLVDEHEYTESEAAKHL